MGVATTRARPLRGVPPRQQLDYAAQPVGVHVRIALCGLRMLVPEELRDLAQGWRGRRAARSRTSRSCHDARRQARRRRRREGRAGWIGRRAVVAPLGLGHPDQPPIETGRGWGTGGALFAALGSDLRFRRRPGSPRLGCACRAQPVCCRRAPRLRTAGANRAGARIQPHRPTSQYMSARRVSRTRSGLSRSPSLDSHPPDCA